MTDYTKPTGTTGTLIIHDTGTTVQAIIKNTYAGTFTSGKSWSISVGAGSASGTFSISGAQEVVVWSGPVTSTLVVSFTMGATNSAGLGGPTTLSVTINRSSTPTSGVPGVTLPYPAIDQITQTTMRYRFSAGSNGGAAIDGYQVGYGTASTVQHSVSSTGTSILTGLAPGTRYNVWSRAHNKNGWGPWSAVRTATTLTGAYIKVNGVWQPALPYVKVGGVWKVALPYVKKNGVWTQVS